MDRWMDGCPPDFNDRWVLSRTSSQQQRASQRAASACLLQLFLEAETDRASGRTRKTLDLSAMGWVGELGQDAGTL